MSAAAPHLEPPWLQLVDCEQVGCPVTDPSRWPRPRGASASPWLATGPRPGQNC